MVVPCSVKRDVLLAWGMAVRGIKAIVSVVALTLFVQPALAQRELNLFFGIASEMIRQGEANRQQQQLTQQQRALETQRQQQLAAERAALLTRMQTALKALGYYSLKIDGQDGPGTRAAVGAYQSAFGLSGAFEQGDLLALEQRAAQGWRSAAEISAANAGGFTSPAQLQAARQAGFATAAEMTTAKAKGFTTARDYAAFVSSGAADKASYEAQLRQQAREEQAVGACLTATQARDWAGALTPCFEAKQIKPRDSVIATALANVLSQVDTSLTQQREALSTRQAQLNTVLASNANVNEGLRLRAEINDLAAAILLLELHQKAGLCADLVAGGEWGQAREVCAARTSVTHLSGSKRTQADQLMADLSAQRQRVDNELAAADRAAKEEANRLGLAEARGAALALIADVEAYAEGGNRFASALEVARALVAMRQLQDTNDAGTIKAQIAVLNGLLDKDPAYLEARRLRLAAEAEAVQAAALEGRRQAEMIEEFVVTHVSANVTSDDVPQLLALGERLASVLAEGNAERIVAAQADAHRALERLGLKAGLDQFAASYRAPQVSAEQLAAADAASASQSVALEQAVASAEQLMGRITGFAENGNKFVDPIAVARGLARLKAAVLEQQLAPLEVQREALLKLVEADTGFVADDRQRNVLSDVALANAVANARETSAALNDFMLAYIADNLSAPHILEVVELQVALEEAMTGPASANLIRLVETVQGSFARLGLDKQHAAYRATVASQKQTIEVPTTVTGLAITIANAPLLEGDPDDLVLLRNAAGTAPNLTLDLVGNLVADGGVAALCWPHPAPDNPIALLLARRELTQIGLPKLDLDACANPLTSADIVILRRGDFLASPPSTATPLVRAFEDGQLVGLLVVAGDQARSEIQRLQALSRDIAMGLENGTRQGFGLLQLTRGAGGICPALEDLAPHHNPVSRQVDAISFFIAEPRLQAPMSAERAFAAAQRLQCSGIYAGAAELTTLTAALARDQVAFDIVPVWVEESEIAAEIAQIEARSAQQVADRARRQQQAEARAKLEAAQRANTLSELEQRQLAQRERYGERALAAQKSIADMVRGQVASGRSADMATAFPASTVWLDKLVRQRWIITDTADELADYGTAIWHDRRVEAVLVRVEFQRENAILGLYAQDCTVLGHLVDTEFRINRDHFEANCSDQQALAQWREGRQFESVWHLTAP